MISPTIRPSLQYTATLRCDIFHFFAHSADVKYSMIHPHQFNLYISDIIIFEETNSYKRPFHELILLSNYRIFLFSGAQFRKNESCIK